MTRKYRPLATVVLFLLGASAAAQDLGRLFHSPTQRAELDRQRQSGLTPPDAADPPAALSINGLVRRHDRGDILFVNGRPVDARQAEALSLFPLRHSTRAVQLSPEDAPSRPVPVGTTMADPVNGETRSTLGEGEIRVHARQP